MHHNIPRSRPYTNSILNACGLCHDCHVDDSKYYQKGQQQEFFEKIVRYLVPQGYIFTDTDLKYVQEYEYLHPILQSLLLNDKL